MAEIAAVETTTYECKACGVQFALPADERAVCCPVCRMNRIESLA